MDALREPLAFAFFLHALVAATMVGGLCGLMGVFIVLRRMSYIGHGLSHSVFGGAVVSAVFSFNFYLGAGLWGFLSALLIEATARRRNIGADAAIGIISTASFALGVAIISRSGSFGQDFEAALFGNILGVTVADLVVIGGVATVVVVATGLAWPHLVFTTFDPEIAPIYGVPARWIDTGFALALAATIVVAMNVVGVTLLAAAIVIPPATARLLTDRFGRMALLSTLLGAGTGFTGMYASYFFDVASGAAIVLLATALFILAYAVTGLLRLLPHRPGPGGDRPKRDADAAPRDQRGRRHRSGMSRITRRPVMTCLTSATATSSHSGWRRWRRCAVAASCAPTTRRPVTTPNGWSRDRSG
ncbi:MAG: metal ABC transporter permease [Chloroflexia bacterium]|nr:metal ABC transporter permease [Chloroflexia bacterium]